MTGTHFDPVAEEPSASPASPAQDGRVSLYGPDFAADPRSVYARLREYGPLAPVELAPGVPATLVTGYRAALEVLRDPGTFPKDPRRWQEGVPADCPVLPMMMYRPNCRLADGAAHRRLRTAVNESLERVDLDALRIHVERSADILIGRIMANGHGDMVAEYARILPLMVLNQLFGCPPDIGDRIAEGVSGVLSAVDAKRSADLMRDTVFELVQLKRKEPGRDVTSWLAAHSVALTDEETVHQILTLLGAGNEPLQSLIGTTLCLLLSDERFAGGVSAGSLQIEDVLDEVLWMDPPFANFAITFPAHDVELAGVCLPKDQPVVISLAAANADPELAAEERRGNRAHLAWSAGPHTCPAQRHARLIASVAVEKLLDALPDLELAVPVTMLTWRPGPFQRSLAALPVTLPPASIRPTDATPANPGGASARGRVTASEMSPTDWPSLSPRGLAVLLSAGQEPVPEVGKSPGHWWSSVAKRMWGH